ncbi:MAG: hypothetical protein RMK91_01120 [Pseudanabaenaceae cyanobacterium SKYGB_i_bin29]|nr:HlyD family secretion protein [Pseudanabaenaceae cyanobacterium SKYG29]MDW8420450.1 hypothetical protein [Pseudanabaenaceae cyanobacterium SKYGB_i_bin29]
MVKLSWQTSIVLGLVGLGSLALSIEQPSPANSNNIPIIRKSTKNVSAPGEIRSSGKTVTLVPPTDISRTLVRVGDQVEAGQVIFLREKYQQLMAELQAAPHRWEQISPQLPQTKVRAPIGGQILRLNSVVEIGNINDLQVIAFLNPAEVKVGQTVLILSQSQEMQGTVVGTAADYVIIELAEPNKILALLDHSFKVKVVDSGSLVSYN